MSTLLQAGRQILDAMSFANVNNLREFRALLRQIEPAAVAPREQNAADATSAARLRAAITPSTEPAQGVL